MSFEETHSDVTQEVAPTPDTTELTMVCEAPSHQDVLPDGREVIVIGDPQGDARFNHLQGDNNEGFLGTCGCVSCEDVLGQFGVTVTEADVVDHAVANGAWQYSFLRSRANSIEGGTTDILKNIIAERVLGLPKLR